MAKRTLTLLLLVMALLISACGSDQQTTASTEAPTEQATETKATTEEPVSESAAEKSDPSEKIKLKIGYGNHLGCALYFIAQEEGYFDEYGLDVELVLFQNGSEGLAALQAGQIDAGSFGSTASFSLISQGQDLQIFGGQMHEGSGIITLHENAKEMSDFKNYKGKTIGLVRMSTGDVVFRGGLLAAGLDLKEDVNIVELESAATVMEAVKKGEIDAGGSWIPHLENAVSQGLEIAMLSGEVLKNHPCAVMVAMDESIQKNGEAFTRLHKALLKAFDLFEHDHEKSIADIQKYLELSTEVLKADAYSRYSPNPEINREACVTFWNMINDIGYVTSDVDINKHIFEDYYNRAIEEMIAENPDNTFYKEVQKGGYGAN